MWNEVLIITSWGVNLALQIFCDVFLSEFWAIELCENLTQFRLVFSDGKRLWTSRGVIVAVE